VVTVLGGIMMWLQYMELLRCGYSIVSYYDVVTVYGVIMMWLQHWEVL
jgi:hypothetical protein